MSFTIIAKGSKEVIIKWVLDWSCLARDGISAPMVISQLDKKNIGPNVCLMIISAAII